MVTEGSTPGHGAVTYSPKNGREYDDLINETALSMYVVYSTKSHLLVLLHARTDQKLLKTSIRQHLAEKAVSVGSGPSTLAAESNEHPDKAPATPPTSICRASIPPQVTSCAEEDANSDGIGLNNNNKTNSTLH